MDLSSWSEVFVLSNIPKGAALPFVPTPGKSIRETLSLIENSRKGDFKVYFDDLELFRPIKFRDLPMPGHAIKKPLIFLGKCREEFKGYSRELSGGPIDFEAYLFWTPKVAPAEHRGSLIRINGASGTLFDPSFMRYQVSEQTRLRQITCEIFIKEGFDSALNIDRESFNYAHPHAVYLTRWLHSALRQLATAQKRVASEIREQNRTEFKEQTLSDIQRIATDVWQQENDDIDSVPPLVEFKNISDVNTLFQSESLVFNRANITQPRELRQTSKTKVQLSVLDEKLKAIVQILASFGLLDNLTKAKQEKLLKAIYQILETAE